MPGALSATCPWEGARAHTGPCPVPCMATRALRGGDRLKMPPETARVDGHWAPRDVESVIKRDGQAGAVGSQDTAAAAFPSGLT